MSLSLALQSGARANQLSIGKGYLIHTSDIYEHHQLHRLQLIRISNLPSHILGRSGPLALDNLVRGTPCERASWVDVQNISLS
jgi:hypothetical protein